MTVPGTGETSNWHYLDVPPERDAIQQSGQPYPAADHPRGYLSGDDAAADAVAEDASPSTEFYGAADTRPYAERLENDMKVGVVGAPESVEETTCDLAKARVYRLHEQPDPSVVIAVHLESQVSDDHITGVPRPSLLVQEQDPEAYGVVKVNGLKLFETLTAEQGANVLASTLAQSKDEAVTLEEIRALNHVASQLGQRVHHPQSNEYLYTKTPSLPQIRDALRVMLDRVRRDKLFTAKDAPSLTADQVDTLHRSMNNSTKQDLKPAFARASSLLEALVPDKEYPTSIPRAQQGLLPASGQQPPVTVLDITVPGTEPVQRLRAAVTAGTLGPLISRRLPYGQPRTLVITGAEIAATAVATALDVCNRKEVAAIVGVSAIPPEYVAAAGNLLAGGSLILSDPIPTRTDTVAAARGVRYTEQVVQRSAESGEGGGSSRHQGINQGYEIGAAHAKNSGTSASQDTSDSWTSSGSVSTAVGDQPAVTAGQLSTAQPGERIVLPSDGSAPAVHGPNGEWRRPFPPPPEPDPALAAEAAADPRKAALLGRAALTTKQDVGAITAGPAAKAQDSKKPLELPERPYSEAVALKPGPQRGMQLIREGEHLLDPAAFLRSTYDWDVAEGITTQTFKDWCRTHRIDHKTFPKVPRNGVFPWSR